MWAQEWGDKKKEVVGWSRTHLAEGGKNSPEYVKARQLQNASSATEPSLELGKLFVASQYQEDRTSCCRCGKRDHCASQCPLGQLVVITVGRDVTLSLYLGRWRRPSNPVHRKGKTQATVQSRLYKRSLLWKIPVRCWTMSESRQVDR